MPDLADPPDVAGLLDLAVAGLGGSFREGQLRMALAVAECLESQGHLLTQAGTGTGKSVGYLVPAVARAVTARERVVISTATLALQRQVTMRDLPVVARALAGPLGREPTFAVLKGWANYLCRHRLGGGYPGESAALFSLGEETQDEPRPSSLGAQVVRLRAWSEETQTGDRDDLEPGVSDRAWRQASLSARECLGPGCPVRSECFPLLARERAGAADVVVTNHAMLGIAAAGQEGVLPEHAALVVDEAHELVDRVTAQATAGLSAGDLERAGRLARRAGVETVVLDEAERSLRGMLAGAPEGRFPDGLPEALRPAVLAVGAAARSLLSSLRPEGPESDPGVKLASAAVAELFETCERLAAGPATGDVVWCETGADEGAGPRLRAAPLDVSGLVGGNLLADRSAVLTSATLMVGGGFEPMARSVGLRDGGWIGLDAGSPFDYPRQAILYIAAKLPPPSREGTAPAALDELVDLVGAAGGRTLGLFSSHRAAVAATEAVRERLGVPVLCQGEDQLPTLVREFAADAETCLFGTLSLWQGVDVPGSTCTLVVIDRIPFARPDDPIRSARSAAADASGASGFMAVTASNAALLLAQGAGRLIRSATDRGVVALLDPRLVTARYGEYLLRTLPPMWRTQDGDVARAALRRLAAHSGG